MMNILKSLKTILIIFLLTINVSCHVAKNKNFSVSSMHISYLKGEIEVPKSIQCGHINSVTSSYYIKDTFLLDRQKIEQIYNQIVLLKAEELTENCDIRLESKIKLVNGDTIMLCVGNFNCLIMKDHLMQNNDTLIYLLRRYSGYYNYFLRKDIECFQEIKSFGIPKEYNCLLREQDPNGPILPPNKLFKDN